MKTGGNPDFRIPALRHFQFLQMCELDDRCFGSIYYKPRRIGWTEDILGYAYEFVTRYRNFACGLQHVNENDCIKNYDRIIRGNNGMPFFFRPINTGSTNPKDGLFFDIPSERITKKMLEESKGVLNDVVNGLGSSIRYAASVTGAYDGDFLGFYYLDEVFKIFQHRLNVRDQWKIIKPCLSRHNDRVIIGKAAFTSTIEEMEDGATVELAQEFWDDSDMNVRDENGRTTSGLYRLFSSYLWAGECDEYGFPKNEETKAFRDAAIKDAKKKKRFDILLSIYRKQPASIDEALSSPPTDCILHPELCEERLYQIRNGVGRDGKTTNRNGEPITPKAVYGNLEWSQGLGSNVVWHPDPNGKWCISQMPTRPNVKNFLKNKYYPGNVAYYRMGCDPYDSATLQGEGSDGAFTVKRLFDPLVETDLFMNKKGEIENVEDMITDQYICDYQHRHANPYDFYEDVLKTMMFYGTLVFPERDKPGLVTWLVDKGFGHWLQHKPRSLWAASQRKTEIGAKASEAIISQYVTFLKSYIPKRIWCCHHPRIIKDWKFFTVKRRTKFDLAVSTGFTELASVDAQINREKKNKWGNSLYQYAS